MEDKYSQIALASRKKVLELVYKAQTSHIGSLFSCADIFAVLFGKIDLDKDKFVLSAGWKAAMLYYHLHRKGRITEDELNSYCADVICPACNGFSFYGTNFSASGSSHIVPCENCNGVGFIASKFIGLAEPIIPEIPIAGGSMGLGFPGAVGLALAKKMKKESGKVYCLMSDGEMQIGTTWESALIARQHDLNNLIVIVDNNKLQAMGEVSGILDIEPLISKWNSFGWRTTRVDGHNTNMMEVMIDDILQAPENKPSIIIADTVKGKGVPFMENNNLYHYKQLSEGEYNEALQWLK